MKDNAIDDTELELVGFDKEKRTAFFKLPNPADPQQGETVKALIDGDGIFCGYCGHRVGVIRNGVIYLKCNHKDAGRKCKRINKLDLQGKIEPIKSVL